MTQEHTRTTIAIPLRLLRMADEAVQQGRAKSRNQLVSEALEELLYRWKREQIDTDFSGMKEDSAYQEEALRIEAEFEASDQEALDQIEED